MAKYQLRFPDDEDRFEQLARITHNLRYFSKIWKEHFGSKNLANMVYWQNKVDEWLKENVDYTDLSEETTAAKENWVFDTKTA
jgi:hypothetical protein